ncbi:MAG TPA: DUF1552 domain-containing protein [Polyangia bacterium]|jgi:hypothetical protein|nr:DUF1552 domain-containing protein [Polyangia bacterium]
MSQKRLSRRTVLRGAGVALALPWLESLAPRPARGQTPATPRSFVAMYFPQGVAEYWKPTTTGVGDAWSLSPILQPLAPIKDQVNVLQNIGSYGPYGGHVEPADAHLAAVFLTCTKPQLDWSQPTTLGASVDQVLAQATTGNTRLDSLQVGLSTLDSYTDGLPGPYSRSISWKSSTQPTSKIIDPPSVFDQIVTGGAAPGGSPLAAERRAKNKSILDYVTSHASTVRGRLGHSDRAIMDQFLTSVRAVETTIDAHPACMLGTRPTQSISDNRPYPPGYTRDTHANIMIDLVVMAIACDVTRIVSVMLDDTRSDFVYDFLQTRRFTPTGSTQGVGAVGGLDGLAHAGNANDGWATVDFWFVQKLLRLAQGLQAIPAGAGTLLDAATIFFGSEMHGANEDGLDLPILTVGGGGGALKTGQCIDFAQTARKTERLANLHLTFLRGVFGLPVRTFGSGAPIVPGPFTDVPANAFGNGTDVIPEILS